MASNMIKLWVSKSVIMNELFKDIDKQALSVLSARTTSQMKASAARLMGVTLLGKVSEV